MIMTATGQLDDQSVEDYVRCALLVEAIYGDLDVLYNYDRLSHFFRNKGRRLPFVSASRHNDRMRSIKQYRRFRRARAKPAVKAPLPRASGSEAVAS